MTLHNPDFLSLDDAYRGLGRLQHIHVHTTQLSRVLQDMERIGFVAIEVVQMDEAGDKYTISASKGKHGPCKFRGSTATYSGAALAALDDDWHLFPVGRAIAVCEKTRAVLDLQDYNGLLSISRTEGANKDILSIEADKLDFEDAVAHVYDQVKGLAPEESDRKMRFYPGPFRMLILQDGTLVRRGKWNNVPADAHKRLRGKDHMIFNDDVAMGQANYLQELYPERGSAGLLGEMPALQQEASEYETDFDSLHEVKEPLRGRLLHLIEEGRKYFLLVGNEASDIGGCCPSEEVTQANQLVKSGILDAFSEPATGDSCPVTMYAFRDEMVLTQDGLTGQPNDAFRNKVLSYLKRSDYSRLHFYAKWVLIAFVAASFVVGMRQCYHQQFGGAVQQVTMQRINPQDKFRAVLVLFHSQKRCYQCLEMERLAHEVMDESSIGTDSARSIGFTTLTIDDPASAELVDQFGIFAATLVLIDYSDPGNPVGKVLKRAPELYRDREAFTDYLKSELEMYFD